ncbi:MAG: glycoside hydrolase family 3 C-terminal domain-containing protein [Clostridia bacterium]|nr:glycoside hydrolase family 3 C-terminal domain-containing protein [Clostridia bacterium]
MKKLFNKKLWETLAFVMACVLVVAIVVSDIAHAKAGLLNEVFQLQTSRVITLEDDGGDYEYFKQYKKGAEVEDYYKALNIEVENEGMVLLKNEGGALPLSEDERNVSLVLSGSASPLYATHGPGANPGLEKTDLKTALTANGFTVNQLLYDFYATGEGKTKRSFASSGTVTNELAWSRYPDSVKNSIDETKTAIVVVTRVSGEGNDVSYARSDGADGSYLSLTKEESEIITNLAVKKSQGKINKIVVLINSAMTVQCDFLFNESLSVDAALWIGNPGGNGMISVAKVLKGEVNPSGRLSDIFLKDNFASPANAYWKVNEGFSNVYANADDMKLGASQKYYGVYVEGIYVGYRYFETRYEDFVTQRANVGAFNYKEKVAYPFGYGLSYSTFAYENLTVAENAAGDFDVSVKVTNTGSVAGKETVQFYLQQPYTEYDMTYGVEKSAVQLAEFAKTGVLAPGASETVTATVKRESMRAFDADNVGTYILDKGKYLITAAKDSHDAINNVLKFKQMSGDDSVNAANMDAEGNEALVKVMYDAPKFDRTTFAKSEQTGEDIVSRLGFMDPNRYDGVTNRATEDGTVTYLSRSDWSGTFPTAKTNLALTDKGSVKYDITVNKPIVEDKDAQMPTYGAENNLMLLKLRHVDYDDEKWDQLLDQLTYEEISKVLTDCFGYTQPIYSINKPYTDEDDGPYGVSHSPYAYSSMSCGGIIAATFNKDLYYKVGEAFAADARRNADKDAIDNNNLNGLYSPGINIHRAAFGGRASEYFSEDPYLSGVASAKQILGMQKLGVIAHPKHFILNDEEANRNGIGIWANEQAVREIYLLPWEYSLSPATLDENWNATEDSFFGGAHAMMTSFNRAGCIWTSASSDLMFGIVRDEWAWDGYAITDMAESNGGGLMELDDGFMNGTTCFLMNGDEHSIDKWASSPTFNQRVREAAKRMLYVTVNFSSAMNGISDNTRIERIVTWWEVATAAFIIVSAVLTAAFVAMLVVSVFKARKQ